MCVGLLAGCGAAGFTWWIHSVRDLTVGWLSQATVEKPIFILGVLLSPAIGVMFVAWLTRRFAPEAEGHGVPEVIVAVARKDGKIRPRVSIVKVIASGLCIGTGGSVGREGPIVQIGASLGSMAGQWLRLPARQVKVLVAAGAAAGISATFNAPLSGVIFASEIILGSFAVASLTPIVIASVLADVVQLHIGEHGFHAAFPNIDHVYLGSWSELPSHAMLGMVCGCMASMFIRLLYAMEDITKKFFSHWLLRAAACGVLVGAIGVVYPNSPLASDGKASGGRTSDSRGADAAPRVSEDIPVSENIPALFGVGYPTVEAAIHLKYDDEPLAISDELSEVETMYHVDKEQAFKYLLWVLPLLLLKPLLTSLTLAGGGSGGVFAPSLFLGATTGVAFGLICNLMFPSISAHPGLYAIVGMGAVVAGTTHGVLSAILIVYEMTDNYQIILPIMVAAGLASAVSKFIEPESIYYKKLSRRGESIARSHETHTLEDIMVRDEYLR